MIVMKMIIPSMTSWDERGLVVVIVVHTIKSELPPMEVETQGGQAQLSP